MFAFQPSAFPVSERVRFLWRFAAVGVRHPQWWPTLAFHGTKELLAQIVQEGILDIKRLSIPATVEETARLAAPTPISELGGFQDYLYLLARLLRPRYVIETGVFRGISTAFLLAALEENDYGQLFSVDLPGKSYETDKGRTDASPLAEGMETGYVIPDCLKTRWTFLRGDSREILPGLLDDVGQIDMFLHDSEHTYETMTWEYGMAYSHLRPRGILLSDDVMWNSAFGDFLKFHPAAWSGVVNNRLGVLMLP